MATLKVFWKFIHVNTPKSLGETEPEPRSGHKIVVTNDSLYSIGGYNPDFWKYITDNESGDTYYPLFKELWKFNFVTKQWTQLKTIGKMPLQLASHSACLCRNDLILYGGTGIPFGEASSNQIHLCNLNTLKWKHISTDGDLPIPGYGSVIHKVGKYFYVFGGTTGWEYNAEVHRLDIETYCWEKILPEGKTKSPEGRYRHESAFYDNKMFIFGGGQAQAVFTLEGLPVFDFDRCQWDYHSCRPDPVNGYPKPRRCHSCVQFRGDVYLCGGYNGQDIFGDIWKINLLDSVWQLLPAKLPQPCYFHSAAITPSGCMYIFGGVVTLDVERTSEIIAIQLCVPSLREMCWTELTGYIENIDSITKNHLRELGIPVDLIQRIH